MIKEFCKLVNVNHKFSTPYHPQTNGAVENLNETLINILRKLTVKSPRYWDTYIPTALYTTYGIANQRMEYEIGLVQIFHLHLRAQPRTIGF